MPKEKNITYLSTPTVARRLGVSEHTVRDLCRRRLLPGAHKDSRNRWRIPEADVITYLDREPVSSFDPSTRWKRFKSRPGIFWPTMIIGTMMSVTAFFFALVSAGADLGGARNQLIEWGLIRAFDRRDDGETLIVIATYFSGTGVHRSSIQDELHTAILEQQRSLHLSELRVEVHPVVIKENDRQKAEELGKLYDATIVIWGSDTPFRIQSNFLNIADTDFDNFTDRTITERDSTYFVMPDRYVKFVTERLSPQIVFLSLFSIAQASAASGDYSTAARILENANTRYASSFEESEFSIAWHALGLAHTNLFNLEKAIGYYSTAIKSDPKNLSGYMDRGIAYAYQGNHDLAIADFTEAINLDPQESMAFNNRALSLAEEGKLDEALSDFALAIEMAPELAPDYYINRGTAFDLHGQLAEAFADYNRAIELDPQNARAYFNRGIVFTNQEKFEQAINEFEHAIQVDPEYMPSYYGRGTVFISLGRYDEGISDLTRIIEFDPKADLVFTLRGGAYSSQGRLDEAITDYTSAIELTPQSAFAYFLRGGLYDELGKLDEAIADYTRAIELEPDSAITYLYRGYSLHDRGRLDEAVSDYTRAIELDPQNADAYYSRGGAYYDLGRLDEAIVDLTYTIEIDPQYADAYMLLEKAYNP